MDDAVGSGDVSGDDLGAIDGDAVAAVDGQRAALNCGDGQLLAGQGGRQRAAGDHVIGEDRSQLSLIFRLQKRVDRAGGQGREGRVRGREHREGARRLQGGHEARSSSEFYFFHI